MELSEYLVSCKRKYKNKKLEQSEQIELIKYFRDNFPNEHTIICPVVSYGSKIQRISHWKLMNAMGYEKNTPDIFIPCPRNGYHGLFLEMKAKGGRKQPEQQQMIEHLNSRGYLAVFCFGYAEAVEVIDNYMAGRTQQNRRM